SQRERDAADGRQLAVERAVAFRITRDFVEQNRRRVAAALLGKDMGDGAHLNIPMGAVDVLQLPHLVDLTEPAAPAAVLNPQLGIGRSCEAHDRSYLMLGQKIASILGRSATRRVLSPLAGEGTANGPIFRHFSRFAASSTTLRSANFLTSKLALMKPRSWVRSTLR